MRWSYFTTTRNDLKRPETIYNEQEMTWNDLPRARNDLKQSRASMKRPTVTQKRPETTHNKQKTTWNDLNEQILALLNPSTWKIINWRARMSQKAIDQFRVYNISYHLCISNIMADRKIKPNVRTKQSEEKKHWIITWRARHWSRWVSPDLFLNWFQTFSIWYLLWVLSLTAHLRVRETVSQW